MDCATFSSPSWINAATLALALAQTVVTAYRWRQRVPVRVFAITGFIVVTLFWLLMIYAPVSSTVELPLPTPVTPKPCEAGVSDSGSMLFAGAFYCLFVALLTHIVLVLVRRYYQRRAV